MIHATVVLSANRSSGGGACDQLTTGEGRDKKELFFRKRCCTHTSDSVVHKRQFGISVYIMPVNCTYMYTHAMQSLPNNHAVSLSTERAFLLVARAA